MERKGNEKDNMVGVIMLKTPVTGKIQDGRPKLPYFVIWFSLFP
jgi:hypothetical protein